MGPAAIPIAIVAATLVSGAVKGYGEMQAGDAQAQADNYRAAIAKQNQQISLENARQETAKGEAETYQEQQKTRATVGASIAAQGASGVDVNTGSAADVQLSERQVGMQDAMTVRSNAARQAYGYESQAANFAGEAKLDQMAAKQAHKAGQIGAISSLLGGGTQAAQSGNAMGLF